MRLYEDIYFARGQMENHIEPYTRHLAADRTLCSAATANQFRLFLHAYTYLLVWAFQQTVPKDSRWRTAQFAPFRLTQN